jgi:hypothetical protein
VFAESIKREVFIPEDLLHEVALASHKNVRDAFMHLKMSPHLTLYLALYIPARDLLKFIEN